MADMTVPSTFFCMIDLRLVRKLKPWHYHAWNSAWTERDDTDQQYWIHELNSEEREYYYSKVFHTAAWNDAPFEFMLEKQTIKNSAENIDNFPSFNSIDDVPMNVDDTYAFILYVSTVATMTSEHMDYLVYWKQFVNLTDEERNFFYDESYKQSVIKLARCLFAVDNSSISILDADKAYVKEIPNLINSWERLSGPAKLFYFELAEEKVWERDKRANEMNNRLMKGENGFEFGDKPKRVWGYLISKSFANIRNTAERNAATIYVEKHIADLSNQPGMTDKRHFQLVMILEQRFKNLSDKARQPYFDTAEHIVSMEEHILDFPENWSYVYEQKFNQQWQNASREEKLACMVEAKQNLIALIQKFPDVCDYFFWGVNDDSLENLIKRTKKFNANQKSTKEASKKRKFSGTLEIVDDGTNARKKKKTMVATDAEPNIAVIPDTVSQKDVFSEPQFVDNAFKESEITSTLEVLNTVLKKFKSSATITEPQDPVTINNLFKDLCIEEFEVNSNTSTDATWEIVNAEESISANESSKSDDIETVHGNEPEANVKSAQDTWQLL